MTTPQILFVDDELDVLAGLRRMLWKRRDEWDLHWCDSGEAALAHLSEHRVDVLVTDMRMPGMDGATLLARVRERSPSTVRFVLSGHADVDDIVKAAGPTQQFLSKPCEPLLLDSVIATIVSTVSLLDDTGIRALIGRLQALPKPPTAYARLTELIARADSSAAAVAQVIESDVSTTAEVLKLVNSGFFGVATHVTSIERAVAMLGLDVIGAVVLAGQVFADTGRLPRDLDNEAVTERGLRGAHLVRLIGRAEGWDPEIVSRLSLAALLHDVGLLIMASADHAAWATYAADGTPQRREVEHAAFGATIGQASGYLLSLWGFPADIVTSLGEQPVDFTDPISRRSTTPAGLAVAAAHQLADGNPDLAPADGDPRAEYLDAERALRWAELARSLQGGE